MQQRLAEYILHLHGGIKGGEGTERDLDLER